MMGSDSTEDAAASAAADGGNVSSAAPPAEQQQQQQQYRQHQHQQRGMMGHRGPDPYYASRVQARPQWPNAGSWPKHSDADATDSSDHGRFRGRPFRPQNFAPTGGALRPSSSPRPVLELKPDRHVPPDLISPRSDSFFYSSPSSSVRPIPSPSPTALHFQSQHRTRAESTPTPRPPRSAFPGLSSNPFIPEGPQPEAASQVEIRKFPLVGRQHEQLARVSPVSNLESPAQSRQPTPTEGSMTVENFSRPRKPSIRAQLSDGALSGRLAATRLHTETPVDHHSSSPQAQTNCNSLIAAQAPHPWPKSRRLSGASSHSSSTFSSIPPRPSNDQLNATATTSSERHVNPNPPAAGAPAPVARPPPAHNSHNYTAPQPRPREVLPPWLSGGDELRSSYRSQLTASTAQGTLFTATGTERNSILTKASSVTEQSIINGYARRSWRANSVDDGPSLEDVMGMYERGFNDSDIESIRRSMRFAQEDDTPDDGADGGKPDTASSRPQSYHSDASGLRAKMLEAINDSLPIPAAIPVPESKRSTMRRSVRRSQMPNSLPDDIGLRLAIEHVEKRDSVGTASTGKHDSAKMLDGDVGPETLPAENSGPPSPAPAPQPSPVPAESPSSPSAAPAPAPRLPQEPPEEPGSRDRYGFRKANAYITRQAYDAWDATYSEYLARRRRKWIAFLKDNSLMTDRPNRFPPRSAKTKRFIRKGIPPDWRGAAWFYYAGGPAILSKHRGVYEHLVRRAGLHPDGPADPSSPAGETGEVKPLIVEDIEKDLYRTFPDNVRFKPPPRPPAEDTTGTAPSQPAPEPEIITSLRRVLRAFALYNPRIGYCQSLNFLAGLLLLFVETEEHAFWLLNIITRVYLPGTHEMSLEGSKVDLGVLMVALKDSMPAVWKQIGGDELEGGSGKKGRGRRGRDHKRNLGSINDPNRLPAITLCMTAWFMSCFIGTLPIETVLRVWDVFFYEGSRTLFRVALTIFKLGEAEIKAVQDPMEMFGVVQSFPRRMIDCNTLMETCYKRRNGIGHLSQQSVEAKREERREGIRRWKAEQEAAASETSSPRPGTRHRLGLDLAADLEDVRRRGNNLFRRKDREQARAAEVM